jgi:iron complex outermembrane receptor protein
MMAQELCRTARVALFLTASVMTLGTASVAFAQDQGERASAPDLGGEIIVTATRRAQALSDVPIAVSAISGEQLEASGVTDIRALNQLAPSLLVSGATSEVNFTARIRGVGTVGENPGLESSVALFIDGVYRSRTGTGLSDLGEIERIEVLRGPQGTLFGRNASAGLINIITRGPEFRTGGGIALTYGNFDNKRIEGNVNLEAVPGQLAFRFDGLWHDRDGYVEDVIVDGRTFNDRNRWMLKGQMLWEPNSDVTLRLIADYSKRDEQCCAASVTLPRNLIRTPQGAVEARPNSLVPILAGLGSRIPFGELYKVAVSPNRDYRSEGEDWGVSGELNWRFGNATLTSITAYRDFSNAQGQDPDFQNLDIWGRTNLQRRFRTFSQEVRLQGSAFDDRLDWLVGGYYADERLRVSDDIRFGQDSERWANCLVALSLTQQFPGTLNTASPTCSNLPATAFPGYAALAQIFGAARLPGTGVGDGGFFRHRSRNYAFFTHNVIDIIPDTLSLTLGARYTNERKSLDAVFNNTNTLCAALRNAASPLAAFPCAINGTAGPGISPTDPNRVKSEDEWTGTIVLSWKPDRDWLVYGSWARGYKAGGFNLDTSALDPVCNPAAGTPAQQAECQRQLALPANTVGNARPEAIDLQFDPETVQSYEFGVKFSRPMFTANLAIFRSEFTDFQLNTFNGVNFEVTNVQACRDSLGGADTDGNPLTGRCPSDRLKPGVRAQGVELEMFFRPIADVNITAGITYSDTKYSRDLVGTGGRPLAPTLFQLPGRQISNAPEYVISGSAGWNPEIADNGMRALFYLDYRLQSNVNTGSDLDVEKIQQAYVIFNGRVGIQGPDRRWSLEFWGQNIFNKKYFQIGADMPLHGGGTFRQVAQGLPPLFAGAPTANQLFVTFPGEPRLFGVTGRFRF